MRLRALTAVLLLVLLARPALAHRLDEYLQATTIALEEDRVTVEVRLTPGVQVLARVLKALDADGDGVISSAEERAYADRVRRDLVLRVDGERALLRLVSSTLPMRDELKEGLGEILFTFEARLSHGAGARRRLTLENHHMNGISAYLVNCLVPQDPAIKVMAQNRSDDQSSYQLDYTVDGTGGGALGWVHGLSLGALGAAAVIFFRRR